MSVAYAGEQVAARFRWLVGLCFAGFLVTLAVAGGLLWSWLDRAPGLVLLGRAIDPHRLQHQIFCWHSLPIVGLPTIFAAELLTAGWEGSSLRLIFVKPGKSVWSDVVCYIFVHLAFWNILGTVLSLGIDLVSGAWIHNRIAALTGVSLTVGGLPMIAQVSILFLIYTFFDYWCHRLDHTRCFWPLHRFHHAAEEFCVATAVRVHPAGFTGVTFMTIMPAVLLSATPESFLTMNVLVAMLRLLIHSRIKSDFGPVGRYVVQSPRHHRLHHRLDPSEPAGNFALIPLWDHLFGTWREIPAHEWAIGVDAPYRHGAWVFSDLWRDYCGFWRGWAALIARRDRRDPAAASELL